MLDYLGFEVRKLHELEIYRHLPLKDGEKLILLVRDFKECLANHNFRRAIIDTNLVIDKRRIDMMFGPKFQKQYRAMQYVENIVLYDLIMESSLSQHRYGMLEKHKTIIYYEDLIETQYGVIAEIMNKFEAHIDHWSRLAELDWDVEAQKVKENYDGVILSERAGPKFHVDRIQDPKYLCDKIYELNPYIYKKYLERYDLS
jgi:hypothetical protein